MLSAIGAVLAVTTMATTTGAQTRKVAGNGKAVGLRGNPAQFFGPDAYPPEAVRNGEQGRVVAKLEVGADGRVAECSVFQSSGSNSLDAATCQIALARVTFTPALDDSGTAIASTYMLPVRWVMPQSFSDVPIEVTTAKSTDMVQEMAVTVDGKGAVERCVVTQASTLPTVDPCARLPVGLRINGGATRRGKPVRARIVTRYSTQTTYDP